MGKEAGYARGGSVQPRESRPEEIIITMMFMMIMLMMVMKKMMVVMVLRAVLFPPMGQLVQLILNSLGLASP